MFQIEHHFFNLRESSEKTRESYSPLFAILTAHS
jgi:hypothetical protein